MAIYRGKGGKTDVVPADGDQEFAGSIIAEKDIHAHGNISADGDITSLSGVFTGDGSGLYNVPGTDTDTYTKAEIDAQQEAQDEAIQDVADAIDVIPAPVDSYTKTQTDTLLDNKANVGDSYTKAETYNNTEIDGKLFQKADKSNTYTKTEVDAIAGSGGGGTGGGTGGGGATGAGGDEVFHENDLTVTTNYTLTTGKNAMSVGPISIASGVTVTIPSDQRWVVL